MQILEKDLDVTLTGDVMFVNGLCFVITTSRDILFTTSEFITNGKYETLLSYLKPVKQLYMKCGFKITNILMDGQFKPLRDNLYGLCIHLNICGSNSQIGEIDRMIYVIKERIRGTYNTLEFKKLFGRLIVELVYFVVFSLNALGESVAGELSVRTVMTDIVVSYKKHCRLEFGECVQTHEYHDNLIQTRTVGAVAL